MEKTRVREYYNSASARPPSPFSQGHRVSISREYFSENLFLVNNIPIGSPTRMVASQLRVVASNKVVLVLLSLGRPKSKGVWHSALVKPSMFRWLWLHRRLAHILLLDDGVHAFSLV